MKMASKTSAIKYILGTVVQNGPNYYAVQLHMDGYKLFRRAQLYLRKNKLHQHKDWKYIKPPRNWNINNLGPHITLNPGTGKANLHRMVRVRLGALSHFKAESNWVIAEASYAPEAPHLTSPYGCHVSCAQQLV